MRPREKYIKFSTFSPVGSGRPVKLGEAKKGSSFRAAVLDHQRHCVLCREATARLEEAAKHGAKFSDGPRDGSEAIATFLESYQRREK